MHAYAPVLLGGMLWFPGLDFKVSKSQACTVYMPDLGLLSLCHLSGEEKDPDVLVTVTNREIT